MSSTTFTICDNYINGEFVTSTTNNYMEVTSPLTGDVIGKVALSNETDIQKAVTIAKEASLTWKSKTVKERAKLMFKFYNLIVEHSDKIADLIVLENGKTKTEALGEVAKGNETVDWACGLPQRMMGGYLEVSRGVTCKEIIEPLGIVASVAPFNFPFMVPMWTIPIALVTGNCVICKPSEKVPLTMNYTASLFKEAGFPDGVFQIIQGAAPAVNGLCDVRDIQALSFVGSSKVAEIVAQRCHALNKRVLALGGAKNHLVALPDCDVEMAANDIVASFAGCCGQRCMAASVLVVVGENSKLIDRVVEIAGKAKPGTERGNVGACIDIQSRDRIVKYIDEAEASTSGAKLLLDGRGWTSTRGGGTWVGPTIILHTNTSDPALHDEIFGPVLSIIKVATAREALEIENNNPYGNAACVYTSVGKHAEYFEKRFRASMIGVNIGIPVPREPFSFGGMYGTASKFGDFDVTGDGAMNFFSKRRKITTKWCQPGSNFVDLAHFK